MSSVVLLPAGIGAPGALPPHVPLLVPFVTDLDVGAVEELRWFFRGVDAFRARFDERGMPVGPDVQALADALVLRWPERAAEVERPPHLEGTIGPVELDVRRVELWTSEGGTWSVHAVFELAEPDH